MAVAWCGKERHRQGKGIIEIQTKHNLFEALFLEQDCKILRLQFNCDYCMKK